VHFNVLIGTDGHVHRIEVISGHPLLVPAAMEVVKDWVYAPIPAAGMIQVTVPFRIDGGNAPLGTMTSEEAVRQFGQQQINGIVGGVPGGVVGGVPGGVVGGVIGSVPSSQPRRIRIGSLVQAAKLISKVDPVYPEQARAAGIEGDVQVDAIIGEDGHVQRAEAIDGHPLLATAAANAVRQWVYQPTYLNGEPTSVSTIITVPFKLQ
jgi:protein TonB